jgi:hypothetical protein
MTGPRRAGRASALGGLLVAALLPAAAEPADGASDRDPAPGPTAHGALAWFLGDDFDLIGDMQVHLPYRLVPAGPGVGYFDLEARTNIERADSEFAFEVRDVDYTLDVGYRGTRRSGRGPNPFASIGQWGTQLVDADGEPWVRYASVGLESAGFRRTDAGNGSRYRVQLGPVLDDRQVEADALFRGEARFMFAGRKLRFGLDARVETLFDGSSADSDLGVGPRMEFTDAAGRRYAVFAHYRDSENPLGLGASGVVVGVDFVEPELPRDGLRPPGVDGGLGTGGGEGRLAGLFRMRLRSPPFGDDLVAVAAIEGNILTADDTGDIYWWYYFGLERLRERGLVHGVYFYHRSNHQLAEPNDRITYINVIEVGSETPEWGRAGAHDGALWGWLDVRLRAGYQTNGSFGEDRRWHLRPGLRVAPWAARGVSPFLHAEAEFGDIERRQLALGVAWRQLDVRVEYRRDEQSFSRDDDAVLLLAEIGY